MYLLLTRAVVLREHPAIFPLELFNSLFSIRSAVRNEKRKNQKRRRLASGLFLARCRSGLVSGLGLGFG